MHREEFSQFFLPVLINGMFERSRGSSTFSRELGIYLAQFEAIRTLRQSGAAGGHYYNGFFNFHRQLKLTDKFVKAVQLS